MASSQEVTKHPEFYYSDGSIVLRVQNTLFKVHQSVLARHSDVFGGMWDMPQPDGIELVDGCPVVELQDDVKDFTDTLWAVYDSFHFDALDPLKSSLKDLLTFISGVLQVSTKYNMVKLRKKCISLLLVKFPNNFENCAQLLQNQSKYDSPDIIRLIRLARRTNVLEVLPWAYYLCTHLSVNDIMHDRVLSWEDKAICLAGKERLWQAQKSTSNSVLFSFTPVPQCASQCQSRLLTSVPGTTLNGPSSSSTPLLMGMPYREAEELRQNPHPLGEFDGWTSLERQICSKCLSHQMALHKQGRQKIWEALPTYFELGTWEDIRREQSS
ncbi:hypothetical protein CC1G_07632 [Coprinopsis cinerea okayama7|uniref:BTB domain-containing protein n=1 Tax=Coprinopsis cinerea (strain Okayama-7 / 130 / ATCC MYA-4618 / FGSC 9003) TaxID=240176 RepID=A8NC28_COPC7|nr:hypothetical protein CC1G_07632 [Coprinopsis cinerea okayama7\|eukprot:XP_001832372.1 hypothetical protein CC1G_07632 [Coprinopsis cinerea okayama7\